MPYTFGKGSGTSVENRDNSVDTAIGVGESATKKLSVGLNKSIPRTIHRRTRCKETFVNGQTLQRLGMVTASPKAKVKAKARENIQEKGTTTRTRLDLRMKTLDSARWVILV